MEFPLYLYVYFSILGVLSIFGIHRYYLVYLHKHSKSRVLVPVPFEELSEIPRVTVQLPIYNEQYVLPRLLEAAVQLDYPGDRLEIQLLDDSTDETLELSQELVAEYRQRGHNVIWIHRKDRQGFKAGALNEGLKSATGEFVAVFDADFVPEPDFLKKMIPYFSHDPKIGMVQARWGHVNRDYSLLTQTQAIFLDGHFVIEHAARNRTGRFFNFNGTAGMWRRQCIEDSGGWSAETLTEDLYLSYKAQMKGWRFHFANEVVVPAELPVDVNAFRTQQHRWAKGSIQTALKLLPAIFRGNFPRKVKVEAFFHLCANFAYLLMLLVSIMMPFSIYSRHLMHWKYLVILDIPLFIGATFSVASFYLYSQKEIDGYKGLSRLKYIPLNLSLGIGLCVNNAFAVLDALFHEGGEFTRTPKYAVQKKGDTWRDKKYRIAWSWVNLGELILVVHYGYALYFVVIHKMYFSIPFVLLFLFAFAYMSWSSLRSAFDRFMPTVKSQDILLASQSN